VERHQVRRFFEQLWPRAGSDGTTTKTAPRRIAVIVSNGDIRRSVALETNGYDGDPPAAVVNAFVELVAGLAAPNPGSPTGSSD
jgi:hypothetical protein